MKMRSKVTSGTEGIRWGKQGRMFSGLLTPTVSADPPMPSSASHCTH